MTDRLIEIFNALPKCDTFADVGCDHGYIAKAMLDEKKCKKVIISDISQKCLDKATNLLSSYIKSGKAESVLSNGFQNIKFCDQALIAGMGGEEIISIIKDSKFLPKTLILQPMKNVDKVRQFVVEKGYKILTDYVFFAEEKYYDLLVLTIGKDCLTEDEIEFGRTNLIKRNKAFIDRLNLQIKTLEKISKKEDLSSQDRERIKAKIERLKNYV